MIFKMVTSATLDAKKLFMHNVRNVLCPMAQNFVQLSLATAENVL